MGARFGGPRPALLGRAHYARWRVVVVALLLALLVLGAAATGYLAYRQANPTDDPFRPTAGSALTSERERARAVAVAEQFALRMDSIDSADFEAYTASVRELLTTKARSEFEQTGEAFDPAYAQAGLKGEGEVLASGVAALDGDSATVLVAHNSDVTTERGDVQNFWRWSVELRLVDGDWLVDGFTVVT